METRKEEINISADQPLSSIQITINIHPEKPVPPFVGVVMRQVIGDEVYYAYIPADGSQPERMNVDKIGNSSEWEMWKPLFEHEYPENIDSGVIILRIYADGSGTASWFSAANKEAGISHVTFFSLMPFISCVLYRMRKCRESRSVAAEKCSHGNRECS
jgi:hypothetical protein